MGKLIKNHLARLVILTAAAYQVAAGLHGMFWPKIFFDIFTQYVIPGNRIPRLCLQANSQRSSLDRAVDWHILQVINIVFGFVGLAWEYPLPFLIPDTAFHRSIAARLAIYPISVFVAILLYQGTNAAIYYMVGIAIYFWAYSEGEVSL
jgi:hypothetical protein